MRTPYWLLKQLPMWMCENKHFFNDSLTCPVCGKPRIPPDLSFYVHNILLPKLSPAEREEWLKYFTTFFSDGFESGDFSAWDEVGQSGGTLSVDSTVSHHGTYSMKCAMSGGADTDYAAALKFFTAMATLYWRCYFRLGSLPPNGKGVNFFTLVDGGGNRESVGVYNDAGTYKIVMRRVVDGGSDWETVVGTTSLSLSANTWYCIELGVSIGSSGWEKVWLDGNLVFDSGTRDNDGLGATRSRTWVGVDGYGIRNIVNWGSAYDVWIDCVVLADTYIGPEVPLKPKGSIVIHAKLAGVI